MIVRAFPDNDVHIGPTGLNEMYGAHWGENPNPAAHQQSVFQWTCTEGTGFAHSRPEITEEFAKVTPLGRNAHVDDIADAIAYLASDAPPW